MGKIPRWRHRFQINFPKKQASQRPRVAAALSRSASSPGQLSEAQRNRAIVLSELSARLSLTNSHLGVLTAVCMVKLLRVTSQEALAFRIRRRVRRLSSCDSMPSEVRRVALQLFEIWRLEKLPQ